MTASLLGFIQANIMFFNFNRSSRYARISDRQGLAQTKHREICTNGDGHFQFLILLHVCCFSFDFILLLLTMLLLLMMMMNNILFVVAAASVIIITVVVG